MSPSLGLPKKMSIGTPKQTSVRLTYMEKWAERISERMAEKGLGDSDISRAIKAKQSSVWQWFNAKAGKKCTQMIRGDNLMAVARLLDLSPEWILTGRGPRELSHYLGLNAHKLEVAIVSVRKATEAMGLVLDEKNAGSLISLAYRELGHYPDSLDKHEMLDFDGFVRHKLRGDYFDERAERPATGESAGRAEEDAPRQAKARGGHRAGSR